MVQDKPKPATEHRPLVGAGIQSHADDGASYHCEETCLGEGAGEQFVEVVPGDAVTGLEDSQEAIVFLEALFAEFCTLGENSIMQICTGEGPVLIILKNR